MLNTNITIITIIVDRLELDFMLLIINLLFIKILVK